MPSHSNIHTKDGISWYCERQGSGPDLVLIPSGEGDCSSYSKVAALLASSFTVTTFDMPGMSRTIAPAAAYQNVTAQLLADQIIGLMDELSISTATFYGCSSGGAAVLALVANHPSRVCSGIVHEVPFKVSSALETMPSLTDQEIVASCRHIFANVMNEDKAAWDALGPEYHSRLDRNYPTWIRNYVDSLAQSLSSVIEGLKARPVTWTIGALSPAGSFFENVRVTYRVGIELGLLPSKHFPQVSVPEKLAAHIREATLKYL